MFYSGGIPFMHPGMAFGGMGGMGGGDDDDDGPKPGVNTTKHYETLGIEKTASQTEIKKAYMKLAKQEHPDKGGDPEKFKEIAKAYEILSDPEKRELYDRHGDEGVESGGGGGGGGAEDMLRMFFGGGAGGRAPAGPRKGEDTVHPLHVTLADCFNGKTVKVAINRTVLEADKDGNMMDRQGNRYRQRSERDVLEAYVERGMKHGQRITFAGKGDVRPGFLPGDVVLVLQVNDHETFQRKGADLIMKKEITLLESLCGVRFVVEHLDGHKVIVVSKPGEVLAPNTIKQVSDEGMPVYGHSQVKGALYIQFDVKFPETLALTDAMKRVLSGVLPAGEPAPKPEAGVPEKQLEEMDKEGRAGRERLARDAYDSDEDGGGGGGAQRVQCAQQ